MQRIILSLSVIICFVLNLNSQSLISVLNNQSSNKNTNRVEILAKESIIKWEGSNLFKVNKHHGTVALKSGHVIKKDGRILGGEFEIDMESIINTDGKYNEMLVNHLKGEDFFDIEKYPEAKLQIREIAYKSDNSLQFLADLTIKGITKEIQFNSKFEVIDGVEIMTSKFNLDRTLWDINYESKGFFSGMKDDIISDSIEFEITVKWPFMDKC